MLKLKIWGPHGPLLGKVGGPMGPLALQRSARAGGICIIFFIFYFIKSLQIGTIRFYTRPNDAKKIPLQHILTRASYLKIEKIENF